MVVVVVVVGRRNEGGREAATRVEGVGKRWKSGMMVYVERLLAKEQKNVKRVYVEKKKERKKKKKEKDY